MDRLCLWLDDPACHDHFLVGGKAAHLSQLAELCYVPPGFCLTTVAYERWAASHTNEITFPSPLREVLNIAYAELAQLALNLEQKMGYAVDIECCWQGGQLYLLQCRPITTLKPL